MGVDSPPSLSIPDVSVCRGLDRKARYPALQSEISRQCTTRLCFGHSSQWKFFIFQWFSVITQPLHSYRLSPATQFYSHHGTYSPVIIFSALPGHPSSTANYPSSADDHLYDFQQSLGPPCSFIRLPRLHIYLGDFCVPFCSSIHHQIAQEIPWSMVGGTGMSNIRPPSNTLDGRSSLPGSHRSTISVLSIPFRSYFSVFFYRSSNPRRNIKHLVLVLLRQCLRRSVFQEIHWVKSFFSRTFKQTHPPSE